MKKFIIFILLFLIFIFGFSLIAIFRFENNFHDTSLLLQYYLLYYSFFSSNPIYLLIFILLINLIIVTFLMNIFYGNLFNRILKSFFALIILIFFSFHISLYSIYFLSFLHINTIIALHNNKFLSGAIITDAEKIKKILKESKTSLQIISPEFSYKKSVIVSGIKYANTFYKNKIITSFPDNYFENIQLSGSNIILVNDYLLINKISEKDLELISPDLAKNLISNTYSSFGKKPDPKITILSKKEYMQFRQKQLKQQGQKMDESIKKTDEAIEKILDAISINKQNLTQNIKIKNDRITQFEKQNEACKKSKKSASASSSAEIKNTIDTCAKNWQKNITSLNKIDKTINEIGEGIKDQEKQIISFTSYKNNIISTKKTIEQSSKNTQFELGLFLSEQVTKGSSKTQKSSISIALSDVEKSNVLSVFLSTLIHEYLHHETYISEDKKIDPFFEEALTEYFARDIITKNNTFPSDIGYPIAYRIIKEMTKEIPEKELLKIYISKDQKKLEELLNKTYGRNFYGEISPYLGTINYLPFDDSLKIANIIMSQTGGQELTKSDFNLP